MDPRLEPFLERAPGWLRAGGPEEDVILSSRVRLARNLAGRRFPHLLSDEEARELCAQARERTADFFRDGLALEPGRLHAVERQFLLERSLASRDLLDAPRQTLVLASAEETLGLMVNEEDHFRAQGLAAGLDLDGAWRRVRPLALHLGSSFELATSPRFGFLTACPTNAGTGLRASLLLHLPALARAGNPLQRALRAAQSSYLAVRGVHGEGSRALGHLYQISNQRTLGSDPRSQVEAVAEYGRSVARFERDVRTALLQEVGNRRTLREDVQRAWRRIAGATRLTTGEALDAISLLRLGALGGLLEELELPMDPGALLLATFRVQPGHLQARVGAELGPAQRDASRARLLREDLHIPFDPEAAS